MGSPLPAPHQTSSTPGATPQPVAGDVEPRHETAVLVFEAVQPEAGPRRSGHRAPSRVLRAALPWTPAPAALLLHLRCGQVSLPVRQSIAAVAWSDGADLYT